MKNLDEAINYAAENLPENCIVRINIERHGYGVELEQPIEGSGIRSEIISMSEESIIDDIIVATDTANDEVSQ